MKKLQTLWNEQSKEVKVIVYILLSAVISQAIIYLTSFQGDNAVVLALVNIALVSLVEYKKRVDVNRK